MAIPQWVRTTINFVRGFGHPAPFRTPSTPSASRSSTPATSASRRPSSTRSDRSSGRGRSRDRRRRSPSASSRHGSETTGARKGKGKEVLRATSTRIEKSSRKGKAPQTRWHGVQELVGSDEESSTTIEIEDQRKLKQHQSRRSGAPEPETPAGKAGKKRASPDEDDDHDETPRPKRVKIQTSGESSKAKPKPGRRIRLSTGEQRSPNEGITKVEQEDLEDEMRIDRGRVASKDDPDFADRTELEIALFNLINGRGLDPLFPNSWKLDFATYPDDMFADEGNEEPLIRSLKGNDFLAIRHFKDLASVGARVRERRIQGLHCSDLLLRCYNKYIKWMMTDAELHRRDLLPVLVVKANRPAESEDGFIKRVQTDLSKLAQQHRAQHTADVAVHENEKSGSSDRAAPQPPPVIFAIIIFHTSVVVVALNAADEDAEPLARANFEYGQYGMDIWHGTGIAIAVALIRDYMLSVGGDEVKQESTEDPDV